MSNYLNAAVFDGGSRRFKSVNVSIASGVITVNNIVNSALMTSYRIIDTAKDDDATGAFDVVEIGHEDGGERKVVIQLGCGCSGMRPWTPNQEYIDRQNAKIEALRAQRGY